MIGIYVRTSWRNVFRNRRRSLIVMTAVALAVAGSFFMVMFMNGMAQGMVTVAIRQFGHVQIQRTGFSDNPKITLLMDDPASVFAALDAERQEIEAYSPRVIARGLARSAANSAGVQILGVDAVRESLMTNVADRIVAGHYLTGARSVRRKEIVLGSSLAAKLDVALGKKIVLVSQARAEDPEHTEMGSGAFRVVGICRFASEQASKSLVFINLADAQGMLNLGDGISEVAVTLRDGDDVEAVAARLAERVDDGEFDVRTWMQASAALATMVRTFEGAIMFYVVIIFLGAAFGIVNTMLMAVFERTREFGILRAIGTRRWALFRMVLYEAFFIGVLGTLGGLVLLAFIHYVWLPNGLDLSIFAESLALFGADAVIKPEMRVDLFVQSVILVLAMSVLPCFWPAIRAARLQPAETMRKI